MGGCGLDGGGGSEGDGSISFQVTGDPEETRVYRELAELYQRRTGRTVGIVEVPERDVHLAKLTTSFSAAQPPDVFLLNHRHMGGFAARSVIEPAAPRLERSPAFAREDFYPLPLKAFQFGGTLQCLPQDASSLLVSYNAAAFREAGLERPRGSWTYEEFAAAARS